MKLRYLILIVLLSQNKVFSQAGKTAAETRESKITFKTKQPAFLNLPKRKKNALGATELVNQLKDLNVDERETAILKQIQSGNVPTFARKLKPIKINKIINTKNYELIFFSTPDYLAIGSDSNYLYIPLTPAAAQRIATELNYLLPTKKMADIIYANAEIKLRPQPIPPSERMTTIPVFWQHSDSVKLQLKQLGINRKESKLVAGHKKDIIISNKIHDENRTSDKVVIYGWHKAKNSPIQSVYAGHVASYADYSHGVRLISETAYLNGKSVKIQDILNDPSLAVLLSNEGLISKPYYPARK